MKTKIHLLGKRLLAIAIISILAISCTDLNVPSSDAVDDFFLTPEQIEQGAAHAYVMLRNYGPSFFDGVPNVYHLNETCTDEVIVPARGENWNDTKIWEELWKHEWTPRSTPAGDGWKL